MVILIIMAILWFAFLELNKNYYPGWIISLLAFVLFYFLMTGMKDAGLFVRVLMWPLLILVLAVTAVLTPPPLKNYPAASYPDPVFTDVITVEQGDLRGVLSEDGKVEIYAGIPYAMPPVGDLRWKEPQDPEPWQGVRDCDVFAPMSMQPENSPLFGSLADIIGYHDYHFTFGNTARYANSEDALYLNIWKPAGEVKDLPVLVYVHGGSLQTGQPWYADYSGEGLARRDCIVVNMGYRLGVFGFLADPELAAESPHHTTGNYGLLDQIKALEWVRDNIAAFGGDADNVTLAGESAGGASVSALCTSPLAKGLFRRVIIESSTVSAPVPAHSFRTLEEGYAAAEKLRRDFGVTTLEELRSLPAEMIVPAADDNHHITVDGYVLTETPYESYARGIHNEEAIMHGYNRTEGALFIILNNADMKNYEDKVSSFFGEYSERVLDLYPAENDAQAKANWIDIYSTVFFNYGHWHLTQQAIANDIPVYEYFFTRNNSRLGYNHGGEEVYFYNNIPEGDRHYNEDDRALGEVMSSYFRNFIYNGDPNGEGLPLWQEQKDAQTIFELGDQIGVIEEPFAALNSILKEMGR